MSLLLTAFMRMIMVALFILVFVTHTFPYGSPLSLGELRAAHADLEHEHYVPQKRQHYTQYRRPPDERDGEESNSILPQTYENIINERHLLNLRRTQQQQQQNQKETLRGSHSHYTHHHRQQHHLQDLPVQNHYEQQYRYERQNQYQQHPQYQYREQQQKQQDQNQQYHEKEKEQDEYDHQRTQHVEFKQIDQQNEYQRQQQDESQQLHQQGEHQHQHQQLNERERQHQQQDEREHQHQQQGEHKRQRQRQDEHEHEHEQQIHQEDTHEHQQQHQNQQEKGQNQRQKHDSHLQESLEFKHIHEHPQQIEPVQQHEHISQGRDVNQPLHQHLSSDQHWDPKAASTDPSIGRERADNISDQHSDNNLKEEKQVEKHKKRQRQTHQEEERQKQEQDLEDQLKQLYWLDDNHRPESQDSSHPSRKSPRIPQNPLHSSTLLTDQSAYVRLGDNVGTTIVIGDFTADRYLDLLVVLESDRPRCITVLVWSHNSFEFQSASRSRSNVGSRDDLQNTSHSTSSPSPGPVFCIDSIPNVASNELIASAAALDANEDGLLDVLLVVRRSETRHFGALLVGDGTGAFAFDQILPDVTPFALVLDANDDMLSDIFFITPQHERIFYVNNGSGTFERHVWRPHEAAEQGACLPTYPYNSNAFVDLDGDCSPDLIVSTTCGLEVWLNARPETNGTTNSSSPPPSSSSHFVRRTALHFHRASLPRNNASFTLLPTAVWDTHAGDANAVFADFNADGATDIAVLNPLHRSMRISYGVRPAARPRSGLCSAAGSGPPHFVTRGALSDIAVSAVALGRTVVPPAVRTGDFNFDGLLDLLFVDADSGTVSLYKATAIGSSGKGRREGTQRRISVTLRRLLDRLLFPIVGSTGSTEEGPDETDFVTFLRYVESPILHHVEDPLAAAFFDADEAGRQDIIISQRHGTRLVWNNFEHIDDFVYFKATAVNIPPSSSFSSSSSSSSPSMPSFSSSKRPFSPLPGNTFKISYGGRHRRETHTCSQCPQSGALALQPCACTFGITRIANYIEQMSMGGAGGVQSWFALMPNALAMVWPQHHGAANPDARRWKVSYLSKGRGGQLRKIVFVLFITLAILFVVIVYMHHVVERSDDDRRLLDFPYP